MQSIRNFRDLGQIKSQFGKIKPMKLLRGGPLYHITTEDLVNLTNHHHLRTIIDFRNKHERAFEPNMDLNDVLTYNLLIMPDRDDTALAQESETTDSDFMFDIYRSFVESERALNAYREFIQTIANRVEEGSVYFHCTAGKDRTGFASAILLKILGVDDEEVYRDFLETNNNIEKDKASLIESIQTFHPFDENDEALLYDVLGVKKAYLETSFNTINERYGDFDTFVKEGLKIEQDTIDILRKHLIE